MQFPVPSLQVEVEAVSLPSSQVSLYLYIYLQVEVENVSLASSLVSRAAWALASTLNHTDQVYSGQVHHGLLMYLAETLSLIEIIH